MNESTVTKELYSKSKTFPKAKGRNKNDFTTGYVSASLDFAKVKKSTCSKTLIPLDSCAHLSYDEGLHTDSNKNCKKGRESGTIQNHIDHKVICVYRTEIEPGANIPYYDHQVTCVHEKKRHYYGVKNKIYDDYLNANLENATIFKDNDDDSFTKTDYGDYLDYISRKKSETEMEKFMETCDLVFDKFTDILFDTVTTNFNTNSQIS